MILLQLSQIILIEQEPGHTMPLIKASGPPRPPVSKPLTLYSQALHSLST